MKNAFMRKLAAEPSPEAMAEYEPYMAKAGNLLKETLEHYREKTASSEKNEEGARGLTTLGAILGGLVGSGLATRSGSRHPLVIYGAPFAAGTIGALTGDTVAQMVPHQKDSSDLGEAIGRIAGTLVGGGIGGSAGYTLSRMAGSGPLGRTLMTALPAITGAAYGNEVGTGIGSLGDDIGYGLKKQINKLRNVELKENGLQDTA